MHPGGDNAMICPHCGHNNSISRSLTRYRCARCGRSFSARQKPSASPPPQYPNAIQFYAFNHQGKADSLISTLSPPKFMRVMADTRDLKGVHFVLTDNDVLSRARALERMRAESGIKIFFVTPHTARPNIINDIYPAWLHTTAQFVVSEGHAEIMRAYGYEKPLHPVGWHLCPIREFRPRVQVRNVLFCPIHPRNSDIDRKANRATFERLKKLAVSDDICLTVRYLGDFVGNGLERFDHPNIKWTQGALNLSFEQIDAADVVIGHQTVAWLAVARGTPTLMMDERGIKTHVEFRNGKFEQAHRWEKYIDLLAYPLDILAEDDTLGLLRRAAACDEEIRDWRRRMIGEPFNPNALISAILSHL